MTKMNGCPRYTGFFGFFAYWDFRRESAAPWGEIRMILLVFRKSFVKGQTLK